MGGELPLYATLIFITAHIPAPKFRVQVIETSYFSFCQTLPTKRREFNFGNIQPASMLRCVVDF
jgi:hypothetical protein